mgnify:CR=1 FL=1
MDRRHGDTYRIADKKINRGSTMDSKLIQIPGKVFGGICVCAGQYLITAGMIGKILLYQKRFQCFYGFADQSDSAVGT